MGFKDYTTPRREVFDPSLDEKLAPEIDDVIFRRAPSIYMDPREFFERTYMTQTIEHILKEIGRVLRGEGGRTVFPLQALFGGGKTHTLLTIYHALTSPEHTRILSKEIYELYRGIRGAKIIVIYGRDSKLAPSPLKPYENIKTLWGYLAYKLGKYELMKKYDESLTVPDKSDLVKLLSGEKAVILIDEILDYVDELHSNDKTKGYAENLIGFFEKLALVISSTDNVLVVTLPVEKRGEIRELEVQARYSHLKEYVKKMLDSLLRVARKPDYPVAGKEELYGVLKKRLFEKIDVENAGREIEELVKTYREYINIFGDQTSKASLIPRTYPFHPSYLEILKLVSERVTGQRTRFAMRVTRALLRKLYEEDENPALIMPWHIDPAGLGLSGWFFTRIAGESGVESDYSIYKDIYDSEVNGISPGVEKRDLVVAVLRTIFLSTYPYDIPTVKEVFPRNTDVAFMVYEPVFFEKRSYKPTDIYDILEVIVTGIPEIRHLHYDDASKRYWFSQVASVREWVEKEARELLSENYTGVVEKIVQETEKLLHSRVEFEFETRRGSRGYRREAIPRRVEVFEEAGLKAFRDAEQASEYVVDSSDYKLVALFNCSEEDAEKLIFRHRDREREYSNTVVVVTISSDEKRESLVSTAARIMAAENVVNKINELYSRHTREVIEIERGMAESLKRAYEVKLLSDILSFYDTIYYPGVENGVRKALKTHVSSSSKSITDRVVNTLSSEIISKIVKSMDYDTLREYLKRVNIVIKPGQEYTLSDILSVFKTRPELPMVREDRVKEAIKDGVLKLEIGVRDEFGNIYFKKIYSIDEITTYTGRDKGVTSFRLSETCSIVHWRDAIDELVSMIREDLKRNGKQVEEGTLRVEYIVKYDTQQYSFESLMKHSDWPNMLRYGFIAKSEKVVKQGVELVIDPQYLEIEAGDKPRITIEAKPIGGYSGWVDISIDKEYVLDHGDLRGQVPFKTWIRIDSSKLKNASTLHVKAIDDNNNVYEGLINIVLKTKTIEITEPGELREGDELVKIDMRFNKNNYIDLLEALEDLEEIIDGEIYVDIDLEITSGSGRVKVSFKNVKPSIPSYILRETVDVLENITGIEGVAVVKPGEKPITLNATLARSLDTVLLTKAKYGGRGSVVVRVSRRG